MWLKLLQEAYAMMEIEPVTPRGVEGKWDHRYKRMEYVFSTSKGNAVKVEMDYSRNELPQDEDEDYYDYLKGEDYCDISFKVNKSYNDLDRSDKERDSEILNGVLGIISDHVYEYKISYFSFTAWSGEGDTKNAIKGEEDKLRQVAVKRLVELLDSIRKLYSDTEVANWLSSINIYERVATLKDILCLPIHELDDERIGRIVTLRDAIVESIQKSKSERIGGKGDEWMGVMNVVDEFLKELKKYKEVNADKVKNRRASLYQKIIQRFLPGWEITQPNPRHPSVFLIKKGR
jgi:hypothetical protein